MLLWCWDQASRTSEQPTPSLNTAVGEMIVPAWLEAVFAGYMEGKEEALRLATQHLASCAFELELCIGSILISLEVLESYQETGTLVT